MHRFLALGDSYTIGEAVAEKERWPLQLVRKLREEGVEIADPYIIATTGWTTDELEAGILTQKPSGSFDLVSLLIGVNNQYRGYGLDKYRNEFEALMQQAIAFAGGVAERVMVLSIPDYGCTPFAADKNPEKIRKELAEYNQVKKELAHKYGAKWCDITGISRHAKEDPALNASDGLHPSGKMYSKWVEKVYPDVLYLLKNR